MYSIFFISTVLDGIRANRRISEIKKRLPVQPPDHVKKRISFRQKTQEQFRNISALRLPFLIVLTTEEAIGTRSGRAGPSFSARPEKEAKGAVLHGTSAAGRLSHVETRSANLPKLDDSHRLKHMGRFVFALRAKIPSRATQILMRVLPRLPDSAQRRIKMPVPKATRNHTCLCTLLSDSIDKQKRLPAQPPIQNDLI